MFLFSFLNLIVFTPEDDLFKGDVMKQYNEVNLDKSIVALLKALNIARHEAGVEAGAKSKGDKMGPWRKVEIYSRTAIDGVLKAYKAGVRTKVKTVKQ